MRYNIKLRGLQGTLFQIFERFLFTLLKYTGVSLYGLSV